MVGGGFGLCNEVLGLEVRHDADGRPRFHDPGADEDLPAHEEMRERVEEEIAARRVVDARLRRTAGSSPTSRAAYAHIRGRRLQPTFSPCPRSAAEARLWYRHSTLPPARRRAASEVRAMNRPAAVPAPVDYPCSDGKPLAESDFQLEPVVYAITALRTHYRHRERVHIASDMFLYFKEGDPRAVVAPDVFVVVGAGKHKRLSYKLWEEPKAPDFVLEVTSRSTRAEDEGRKRAVYASLGIGEYWLFDPTGDWLAPRLQGFRLHAGEYRALPSVAMVGGGLGLHSEVLGLEVRHDADGRLRFHDPQSGEDLPAHEEMRERVEEEIAARRAVEARLGEEAAARRTAEARLREEAAARRATEARLEEEVAARDARIAELEARFGSGS